jgi:CDP-2,3-bis-(O-geranylgeranyl)-sn-glycerol synthase
MHPVALLQLLVLLGIANGAPVVAKKLFDGIAAWPLDGGAQFFDGRPLFGRSKTVRGIVVALVAAAATAPLLGLPPTLGIIVAATAMAGDLFSSFTKRRLNRPPSSRSTGLDQIPEALLPLIACGSVLSLTTVDIIVGVALFFVGEVLTSLLFYRLGLRDRPY